MKRLLPLFCAALVAVSCNPAKGPAGNSRVMVLGIDGGTWDVIEPMMAAGELPNLKKLYDGGLHGVLNSRPPILSPVVWTTIFTGFLHEKHGVKDWKTSQSVNRRVSAIWEILREKDKRVDVFNVPATWPPDVIRGAMLSGFPLSGATFAGNTGEVVTKEQLEGGKTPAAVRENIDAIREAAASLAAGQWSGWLPGKVASRPQFRGALRVYRIDADKIYVTPLYRTDEGLVISEPRELRSEVSEKIGEPYIPEGPGWSRWADEDTPVVLYDHLEQVFSIQSKAALEFAGGDWDVFLYVMTLVDRVSHPYWAYGHAEEFPTLDPERAKKFASAVPDAYRRSDEELGKLLAKAGGDPYVIIVSDHGFQSSTDKTKPIGTHNPAGIYLVSGPGITARKGKPTNIEDVTPTMLYLLGLPVAQDMDGKPFPEVVEMVGRDPETIPSYETGNRDATDEPVDADTWESLKGLGYVDGAPPRAADQKKPEPKKPPKAPAKKPGAPGAQPGAKAGAKAGAQPGAQPGAQEPPAADPMEDWPDDSDHHDHDHE